MKIYTKQGDEGRTTNILGEKLLKSNDIMELQGSIDEINATIGVLRSKINNISAEQKDYINSLLKTIQYHLYEIGVEVSYNFTQIYIREDKIKLLEENMDKMTDSMPPLTSFIYYGGVEAAAYCHFIRAVVRRTERVFVRFNENIGREIYNLSYKYINRLSDFFFTLGRYINFICGAKEEALKK
ncbi:MAG: cob(I)yrinic acid a,c-diamide adenosyltransferase [Clostridiales bacterium]|uniref:cob(I)yrinic acid a,c-diamide adenosyltransferase n=1 Tax=Clostridium sp. N3C TaxID=1776758 RepID=UPI00092E02B1|nr:cob(I)yrinic acid a,c-diamide adenosyltransferase [Clostridium sp. N3C]NLZ49422.1 cob(I)yrinic acid a,c-diamide adenosyltransferase [Clostridiales bacterium]SCN25201.1 Cob(I)yrinic acid a,c-diamide adenosyltransferase [Clostridium sp. N3C]